MIMYKRSNRYKYDTKYQGILIVLYTRCTRKVSMPTYNKLNVVVCRRYFFLLRELFPELLVTIAMKFWAAVLSQDFQNLFNLRRLYQDHIQRCMWGLFKHVWRKYSSTYGSRYSRMDQVKFVEDSLSRPCPFRFFKGCLPQILLGPFLNTLSHMFLRALNTSLSILFCNLNYLFTWPNEYFSALRSKCSQVSYKISFLKDFA